MNLSDCTCPICMYIIIEPVTMPCGHELCLPCFQQNVQEASLTCPMCRTRISTWARKAARNNKLVNKKRWEEIKQAFPLKVMCRLEGKTEDYTSGEDEDNLPENYLHLAEPGAIRQEYEDQLRKLEEERQKKLEEEEEASRKLIEQLQQQEDHENQEKLRIHLSDEALAKELSSQMKEAHMEMQTPEIKKFLDEKKKHMKTDSASSLDKFIKKTQRKADGTLPEDAYPYNCISPADKTGGQKSRPNSQLSALFNRSASSTGSTTDYLYIDSRNSSRIDTDLNHFPSIKVESASTRVSSELSVEVIGESFVSPKPSTQKSQLQSWLASSQKSKSDTKLKKTAAATATAVDSTENRPTSSDSLAPEMVHFRPIVTCPTTPPKRLPNGRVEEARVVRSLPRSVRDLPCLQGIVPPTDTRRSLFSDVHLSPPSEGREQSDEGRSSDRKLIMSAFRSRGGSSDQIMSDHTYWSPKKNRQITVRSLLKNSHPQTLTKTSSTVVAAGDEQKELPLLPILPLDMEVADGEAGSRHNTSAGSSNHSLSTVSSSLHAPPDRSSSQDDIQLVKVINSTLDDSVFENEAREVKSVKELQDCDRSNGGNSHFVDSKADDILDQSLNENVSLTQGSGKIYKMKRLQKSVRQKRSKLTKPSVPPMLSPKVSVEHWLNQCLRSTDSEQDSQNETESTSGQIWSADSLDLASSKGVSPDDILLGCGEGLDVRLPPLLEDITMPTDSNQGIDSVINAQNQKQAVEDRFSDVESISSRVSRRRRKTQKDVKVDETLHEDDTDRASIATSVSTRSRKQSIRLKNLKTSKVGGGLSSGKTDLNENAVSLVSDLCCRNALTEDKENSRDSFDTSADNQRSDVKNKLSKTDNLQVQAADKRSKRESANLDFSSGCPRKKLKIKDNRFDIEYSPGVNGKKLMKLKADKKKKLSSSIQTKLTHFMSVCSEEEFETEQHQKKVRRKRLCQKSSSVSSGGEVSDVQEEEDTPRLPVKVDFPGLHKERLNRSHFASDSSYQAYIVEQDRLLAIKLQADFDFEAKFRLNSLRTKGSGDEYNMRTTRRKANLSSTRRSSKSK